MNLSNCVWPSKTWEPGELCPLNNPSSTEQSSHSMVITKTDQVSKTLIMENLNQYSHLIVKIPQPFEYPEYKAKNLSNTKTQFIHEDFSAFEKKNLSLGFLDSKLKRDCSQSKKKNSANRCDYILPYDDNFYAPRSIHQIPYYLNASQVFSCVAAQAPLKNTLSKFWAAAFADSSTILCLYTPKYPIDAYWDQATTIIYDSLKKQIGKVCRKENIEIIYQSNSPYGSRTLYTPQRIVKRIFEYYPYDFENNKLKYTDKPTKTISHYHFENWTDDRTPDLESLKILLTLVDDEIKADSLPFIHCEYGIGQTGALIALHYLYDKVKDSINNELNPNINIINLINRMRIDRGGMVETQKQLDFISFSIYELAWDYKNKFEQMKNDRSLANPVHLVKYSAGNFTNNFF